MFFFLSKILAFLITPLIWVFALLIYSLINRDQKKKKRALILAVLLLFTFSNSFIFNEVMKRWEIPAQSQLSGSYETGIVLGGVSFYDSEIDRVQFNRSIDRLMQAVRLYKEGKIRKIFFTGGSGSLTYPDTKEAPQIKKFLVRIGIPESDIIVETESRNTHENASFSKPLIENISGPGKTHLLITSGYHMRRALGCFKKEEIDVIPYATDRSSGPTRFQLDYLFIPSAEVMHSWTMLIHELTGFVVYKAAGYSD